MIGYSNVSALIDGTPVILPACSDFFLPKSVYSQFLFKKPYSVTFFETVSTLPTVFLSFDIKFLQILS